MCVCVSAIVSGIEELQTWEVAGLVMGGLGLPSGSSLQTEGIGAHYHLHNLHNKNCLSNVI